MSRIWAVARLTIAEGIRMKIALVFIAVLALILPVMPFTLAGDGLTLTSKVQSFLSYSLGASGFLLSLLTIFLACSTIAGDIYEKHIYMIASKPIARWQFVVGKWTGIMALNSILLLGVGLMVWGFTQYLKTRPTTSADHNALNTEVLSVRHGFRPTPPNWDALVDAELRERREAGRLGEVGSEGVETLASQIRANLKTSWKSIGPHQGKEFMFTNVLVDPEKDPFIELRFKPTHASGVDYVDFHAVWQAGDPEHPETLVPEGEAKFIVGRYHTMPIPSKAVNADHTLYLRLANLSNVDTIVFEGDDNLELLFTIGTFHWNLVRMLSVTWSRLAFLTALGLLMSSFLSFPVACLATFLIFIVASWAGFFLDSVDASHVKFGGIDPLWIFGPVIRPLVYGFLWVVPDFSKFDAVENVVAGRNVPLMWVINSIVMLVLTRTAALITLGCVILTRRELARVTV